MITLKDQLSVINSSDTYSIKITTASNQVYGGIISDKIKDEICKGIYTSLNPSIQLLMNKEVSEIYADDIDVYCINIK